MAQEFSLEQQQKINRLMARASWQRTGDIAPDILVPKILPKATSLKSDWTKFNVDVPSVFQLLSGGVDVTHLVYMTHTSPDDTMVTEGRCKRNEVGRGYCMAVGDYWVYVPLLTGDPASFSARLSDASSELPSAASAIDTGGSAAGVLVVSTLNRALPRFKVKTVAAAGTAEQFTAQAVPGGFGIVVKPLFTNTGAIWIAETQAKAQAGTHVDAWELQPGDSPIKIALTDWSVLWMDVAVNGEGARIGSEV